MIRASHYAGRYYFADEGRLRASVESFIEDSSPTKIGGEIQALIVPRGAHAECGAIAGFAYKLLLTTPQIWDIATLFAPVGLRDASHNAHSLLCDPAQGYETPMDLVRLDHGLIESLCAQGAPMRVEPDQEFGIECQLPFVQVAMGDVPVVPLRVPEGFDAASLTPFASQLGLIIATANLPAGEEQITCDAITNLDVAQLQGSATIKRVKGLAGLFGSKARALTSSADLSTIALAVSLAYMKGASAARILKREGSKAAIVVYGSR